MLAFARAFEATAQDDALDLLDLLITDVVTQARHLGQDERLRTLRDLDAAALQLREACAVLFDEACADRKVRATVFAHIPEPRLREAVSLVETLARPPGDDYHKGLVGRYGRVRRFLPALLREVAFEGTQAGQALLRALKALGTSTPHQPDLCRAPLDFVSRAWRPSSSGLTIKSITAPTRYACWKVSRTACVAATFSSPPANAGVIPAPSCCTEQPGRPTAPSLSDPGTAADR